MASRVAFPGHGDALDLLEVRQLDLIQLHHVHREPDGAREGHRAVVVGRVHLLQVTLGDEVAHGGPPVARDEHAVPVGEGQHGRAVRGALGVDTVGKDPPGAQQLGAVGRQELREGRGARCEELLPQPALVLARHVVPPSVVTVNRLLPEPGGRETRRAASRVRRDTDVQVRDPVDGPGSGVAGRGGPGLREVGDRETVRGAPDAGDGAAISHGANERGVEMSARDDFEQLFRDFIAGKISTFGEVKLELVRQPRLHCPQ